MRKQLIADQSQHFLAVSFLFQVAPADLLLVLDRPRLVGPMPVEASRNRGFRKTAPIRRSARFIALRYEGRSLTKAIAECFSRGELVDAFQYGASRDLTGYEDGTEIPTGDTPQVLDRQLTAEIRLQREE